MSVVRIENATRMAEIEAVRGTTVPGQFDQPVEIVPYDLGFGSVGMHGRKALDLAIGLFEADRRHNRARDLGPILLDFVSARVHFTEFILDRTQLLAKEHFSLAPRHLLLGLGLDLGLHTGDFQFPANQSIHLAQSRQRVRRFQHLLGLRHLESQIRSDGVGQAAGLLDIRGDREHFGRQILQREELLHPSAYRANQCFPFHGPLRSLVAGNFLDAHSTLRPGLGQHSRLGDALHKNLETTVGESRSTGHSGHGAHRIQFIQTRIENLGIPLGNQ